ncbi:hypothetical protein ACQPW3_21280 [Actinosynnema sp. CA-248983]
MAGEVPAARFAPRALPSPGLAAYVSQGLVTAMWKFRADVLVHASAQEVAAKVQEVAAKVPEVAAKVPEVAVEVPEAVVEVPEAVDEGRCGLACLDLAGV